MSVAEAQERTEVDFGDGGGDDFEGLDLGGESTETDSTESTPEAPTAEPAVESNGAAPARDTKGRFTARTTREQLVDAQTIAPAPVAEEEPPAADDLFERAGEYGLSAEEAQRFDRDTLLHWMAMSDRRAAEWGLKQSEQDDAQWGDQDNPPPQAPAQQPPPQTQQPQQPQQTQPAGEYQWRYLQPIPKPEFNLDPEVFEPEAIQAFTQQGEFYHQQLAQQQQVLDAVLQALGAQHENINQFTGQSQAEQQARIERDMDTWFDNLGPEWADEFGKGPASDMADNSPQLANRQKVARQMKGLAHSFSSEGKQPPSLEVLRDRAFGSLYYTQIQSRARKELASKVADRNKLAMPRPSSMNGKPKTGDQIARENARKWFAEHDFDADDDDGGI